MEKQKKKVIQWILGICVGVLVLGVLGAVWLYGGVASGARLQILYALGAPVGVVGNQYITARDIQYFSTIAGDQTPTSALVHALQVEAVAAGRGLQVSASDVHTAAVALRSGDEYYKNFEAQHGQAAALRVLATPYVYKNYLRIDYMKQGQEQALTQQLQSLSSRLQTDEDWKIIASIASDDLASSWSGGDVGYVDLRLAVPEYAQAVQGLPLHTTGVVYTRFGAHIVEVRNRVMKDNVELTQLREIVLRPKHFDTWLAEQTALVPVKWYLQVLTSIE